MYKILKLDQGSDEWLEARRKSVTATDISAIMGVNPWKSAYDVFLDKIGEAPPFVDNPATIFGRRMEPIIREHVEEVKGEWFPPAVVQSTAGWGLASLDGISSDHTRIIEIKTCGHKAFQDASHGKVSVNYAMQAQWALMCVPCAISVEFIFYNDGNYQHVFVYRDEELISAMLEAGKEFYDESIIDRLPPALSEKDKMNMENDFQWMQLADRAQEIQLKLGEFDALQKELKSIKSQLVECTDDSSCEGGGVTLTRSWREGGIDLKKMLEDGINIEKYRKSPTSSITMRINPKKRKGD